MMVTAAPPAFRGWSDDVDATGSNKSLSLALVYVNIYRDLRKEDLIPDTMKYICYTMHQSVVSAEVTLFYNLELLRPQEHRGTWNMMSHVQKQRDTSQRHCQQKASCWGFCYRYINECHFGLSQELSITATTLFFADCLIVDARFVQSFKTHIFGIIAIWQWTLARQLPSLILFVGSVTSMILFNI